MKNLMKKNSKLLTFLLSLVIAAVLWTYVVTTVTPEDSSWIYNIPVTFTNEDGLFTDRDFVLSKGRDSTVNLKLSGKRQDLLKLNNTNITITADLSQVTSTGDWALRYEIDYPETVTGNDISVESRSSYSINITVDKLATKNVEVQAVFQGSVAEGYTQEAIELEYETVEISGPKELVNTVDAAQVVLERTNVNTTVSDSLPLILLDEDGNEIESEELRCRVGATNIDKIGVMMPVNMVKEVALAVELIPGGGATADHAVVEIEPSRVTIKGDPEVLETMNSITLGTIDLGAVQTTTTKEFNVVIADGLTNQTSDTASVTVELKNLKTKTFRVTNIGYVNAPEDLKVQLTTVSLQVQVRGPAETIDALAASSIRAEADLSGLNGTGQYSVNAEIYVDSASDVGAMGSYSVLLTISEATAETTTAVEITGTDTEVTEGGTS